MRNGLLGQTALFHIRREVRTGDLAEMICNRVALRIAAVLDEAPLRAGGFGGLADVDFLDQRVRLFKALLDDRWQRIEIGLRGVDRAEQIDDPLLPGDLPQKMFGRTVSGLWRRCARGRQTTEHHSRDHERSFPKPHRFAPCICACRVVKHRRVDRYAVKMQ